MRYRNTDGIVVSQRFGRLVALSLVIERGRKTSWRCLCDCGHELIVRATSLRSGDVKSCGCLRRPHGKRGTSEYGVWQGMIQRCENQAHLHFKSYGGRGIKVCSAWRNNFVQFLADVGSRPSLAHSIDRIDNNGDYRPDNCRWVTDKEQANNRRAPRGRIYSTLTGVPISLREMAGYLALSYHTMKRLSANSRLHHG